MTAKQTRVKIKDSDLSDLQKRMALILLAVNGVDNAMRFVKLLQERKSDDLR